MAVLHHGKSCQHFINLICRRDSELLHTIVHACMPPNESTSTARRAGSGGPEVYFKHHTQ